MADPASKSHGVSQTARMETGFRVQLVHGPSDSRLTTEAPKDNGGTGSSFSPTDLVASALASCAITTMQLAAHREGIPFPRAEARIEKRMTPPPRRVGELLLSIDMPPGLTRAQRERLEEVARTCPVARSLHPNVHAPMVFRYPEDLEQGP